MAEYYNPAGGNFSESHAKRNPFLMVQSVSATPVSMNSPMKILPLIPILAAGLAKAGTAIAATKVGAAVVGGVKTLGAKLAATKVGGAVVKGAQAVSKGVKAIKGFTGKIKSKIGGKIFGKKAAIGNISKATEAGTEATKSESFVGGKIKEKAVGEIEKGIAKRKQDSEVGSAEAFARGRGHIANAPSFETTSHATKEDDSFFAFKKSLQSSATPLVLRAKRESSPLYGKKKQIAKHAAFTTTSRDKVKELSQGFGVNPITFTKV
tara:strand:+ start:328 stop:1122 length:795 start_codon:yes stop_codon:yes gene_type:complete